MPKSQLVAVAFRPDGLGEEQVAHVLQMAERALLSKHPGAALKPFEIRDDGAYVQMAEVPDA